MNFRLKTLRKGVGETAPQTPGMKQPFSYAVVEGHPLFSIVSAGLSARDWLLAEPLGKSLQCGSLLLLIEGQSKLFRSKWGSSLDSPLPTTFSGSEASGLTT